MSSKCKYNKRIFEDTDTLYETVAELIVEIANKNHSVGKKFSLVLSGGQTPTELYKILAIPSYSDRMPWQNTYVFWGDERCVPETDIRSNFNMAESILLKNVPIPRENIYRIPATLSPVKAAKAYKRTLNDFFHGDKINFDLVLLGLGENGHTASLFPGTSVIYVRERDVREIYLEDERMFRITMTVPLFNQARNIFFMVTGANKATVLKNVLDGEYRPSKYPAQLVCPENGYICWFIDHEAAEE